MKWLFRLLFFYFHLHLLLSFFFKSLCIYIVEKSESYRVRLSWKNRIQFVYWNRNFFSLLIFFHSSTKGCRSFQLFLSHTRWRCFFFNLYSLIIIQHLLAHGSKNFQVCCVRLWKLINCALIPYHVTNFFFMWDRFFLLLADIFIQSI